MVSLILRRLRLGGSGILGGYMGPAGLIIMPRTAPHPSDQPSGEPASLASPHRLAVRVYYEDTDFAGVVYHASYLRFLERGRTQFSARARYRAPEDFWKRRGGRFSFRGARRDHRVSQTRRDGRRALR
jgi:hypothetical protein